MFRLRLFDRLARRRGYVPSSLFMPRWQRVELPFTLPDLKAGNYTFAAWVKLSPTTEETYWMDLPVVEALPPEAPYTGTEVVTGPAGSALYPRGALRISRD